MRVGFDAGPIMSSYSGIGQYVRCLFPAMVQSDPTIEWVAYVSSKNLIRKLPLHVFPDVSVTPCEYSGFFRVRRNNPAHLNLFHGTNFKAPDYGQPCTVLTIHDLWLTRNPGYSKKFFGQAYSTWKLCRRARHVSKVIAVSQFSAQEIQEVFHLPSERIAVIHHGCSPAMFPDREEERFQAVKNRLQLPDRPFILFMGGAEPRKNHTVLFQAFSQSAKLAKSFSLVAVGEVEVRGASLMKTAGKVGISRLVCCPGSLSVEDLRVVYSHAECFVFPSLYEGFGIPLLEAMACGAPVITGTGSALSEVAGDAALYVNVQDAEQVGIELERLVGDRELQEHLRRKGYERVKQFTWDRAAKETLALYRNLVE